MKKKLQILGVIFMIVMCSSVFSESRFNMSDSDYDKLVQESLVSTGNNYRLKKAIEKIKNGEKVWIAALGGSVTEGAGPAKFTDGYAYQFFRAMKKAYAPGDGKNLYFNNAGLSGTPSLLGRLRYESDVVKVCGQNPDILIIEFAVNDGGETVFQKSFEAIVRDALLADSETAVIALYSAATYGNTSAQKRPIADFYEVPQVNMLEIVNKAIKQKNFLSKEYYTDIVHPTIEGHTLMADCLMNLIDIVDKSKIDQKIDVPLQTFTKSGIVGLKRIEGNNKNVKISKGSFTEVDKYCQSIKKTNQSNFPINWHKPMDLKSKNEPFEIDIKCKSFVFVYKVQAANSSERFGKAEVYIDGRLFETFDGAKEGGWNNCEQKLLFYSSETRNHKIEVKMAEGSEKLGFTIVAMGYVE